MVDSVLYKLIYTTLNWSRRPLICTKPRIHQHLFSPYLIFTEEHIVLTLPWIHQIHIYQSRFFSLLYGTLAI